MVRDRIPEDQVTVLHGASGAPGPSGPFYEMQQTVGDLRTAVAVGAACAAELTSVARMRLYAATRRWYRDVRTIKAAVEMAVEDCRSPQEDRFRMLWSTMRVGVDPDQPDCPRPPRGLRRHPRPARPGVGVAGEYAGADHRDIDRHEADIDREAAVRWSGLEFVEVVARGLRQTHAGDRPHGGGGDAVGLVSLAAGFLGAHARRDPASAGITGVVE